MVEKVIKKCRWCGKPFKRQHNRQVYCTRECAHNAHLEQKAEYARRYRRLYKPVDEKNRVGLGSGYLGQHAHEDFLTEHQKILFEKRRLKLCSGNARINCVPVKRKK